MALDRNSADYKQLMADVEAHCSKAVGGWFHGHGIYDWLAAYLTPRDPAQVAKLRK